ncbi:restriction endonuclease [Shigella flexneri]|nr:restriction endonuclease [Shigella flexneri]
MLPSETMIWQPEFTDKTLSRKTGAVHRDADKSLKLDCFSVWTFSASSDVTNS